MWSELQVLNVKTCGTYSYHYALKRLKTIQFCTYMFKCGASDSTPENSDTMQFCNTSTFTDSGRLFLGSIDVQTQICTTSKPINTTA